MFKPEEKTLVALTARGSLRKFSLKVLSEGHDFMYAHKLSLSNVHVGTKAAQYIEK